MTAGDASRISAAFAEMGWSKPESQFVAYHAEQRADHILVFVAECDEELAGYVTLRWESRYVPFAESSIPEIQDLNVVEKFRRRGVATALMDEAEATAFSRGDEIGIGVGLHPGYGAAQRMYVRRGYLPDARPVTCDNRPVSEGDTVRLDDKLVLQLTKRRVDPL